MATKSLRELWIHCIVTFTASTKHTQRFQPVITCKHLEDLGTSGPYLGELGAELLSLLLRQARWKRVDRVPDGSLHRHVGQAFCLIHNETLVRRVQVDIWKRRQRGGGIEIVNVTVKSTGSRRVNRQTIRSVRVLKARRGLLRWSLSPYLFHTQ